MNEAKSHPPTVVIYGSPSAELLHQAGDERGWGVVVDNGRARDRIFTIYENFARADGFIGLPNAHPIHLLTLLAEAEVGHPLILQGEHELTEHFLTKPITFLGTPEEWRPFHQMFQVMKTQGLLRDGFDRLARYAPSIPEALCALEDSFPATIDPTRMNYYLHAGKPADLEYSSRNGPRQPTNITAACFGSASTKNPDHLVRTDKAAEMLARLGINILHGGGDAGVMGQLSRSAATYGAYVKGVTVHSSGAPKIFFERAAGDAHPLEIDLYIASKDMIHRMESYAGHSEVFISLDGGLGSIQEVLVIADLIAAGHPVTRSCDATGSWHAKPLFLLNESGIYTPILQYLRDRGYHQLLGVMKEVRSIAELEQGLSDHLRLHPPRTLDAAERRDFRCDYPSVPRTEVTRGDDTSRIPSLPNLDGAFRDLKPPSRDRDNGLHP
jgi:predicted Rossmann-fold nucleotide-binding protein